MTCFAAIGMAISPEAHWRSIGLACDALAETRRERGKPAEVHAGGAGWQCRAEHDVIDVVSSEARTVDSVPNGVTRQRRRLDVVQRPRKARPIGVRAVETINAPVMRISPCIRCR